MPLAFDTGPGNVLIDEAVRLLTGGALTFDRDGRIAATGMLDRELLATWMRQPYFQLPIPKSTGRELFGAAEARVYVQQARERGLADADIVATLTAFTAHSIADAYRRFLPPIDEVLVGGGGARNPTLMRMLAEALPDIAVRAMDDVGLDADAKEAVAFALLGYATLHGWPGNVPSATGAARPVVLGQHHAGRQLSAADATRVGCSRGGARRYQGLVSFGVSHARHARQALYSPAARACREPAA